MRATLLLLLAVVGLLVPATPVAAQDDGPCPVEDGAVPAVEVNGPSTTGQCAPSRGMRLIDAALWVFTLGVIVVVVVGLVRSARSSREDQ